MCQVYYYLCKGSNRAGGDRDGDGGHCTPRQPFTRRRQHRVRTEYEQRRAETDGRVHRRREHAAGREAERAHRDQRDGDRVSALCPPRCDSNHQRNRQKDEERRNGRGDEKQRRVAGRAKAALRVDPARGRGEQVPVELIRHPTQQANDAEVAHAPAARTGQGVQVHDCAEEGERDRRGERKRQNGHPSNGHAAPYE